MANSNIRESMNPVEVDACSTEICVWIEHDIVQHGFKYSYGKVNHNWKSHIEQMINDALMQAQTKARKQRG